MGERGIGGEATVAGKEAGTRQKRGMRVREFLESIEPNFSANRKASM
jgi:hypothetical protein